MMKSICICLATTAFVSGIALAEEEEAHVDVLVSDRNGKLVTGAFDFETGTIANIQQRVFEGELGDLINGVYDNNEPGFNAVPASELPAGFGALAANTGLNFNIKAITIDTATSNLWYWDGVDDGGGFEASVDFQPANGATLNYYRFLGGGAGLEAIADGSASDIAGFEIDLTNDSGFLHRHRNFRLDDGDGDINTAPPAGFYALPMEATMTGFEASEFFVVVLDAGIENEAAHEAAAEFFEQNVVPEPASLAMLCVGGALMLRRPRRS